MNIKELLSHMSTREKILQLEQLTSGAFAGNNLVEDTGPAAELKLQPGDLRMIGTSLPTRNAEKALAIQEEYMKNNPHKIPLLFMDDIIHGYRTVYPLNIGLSCSFSPETVEECSAMAAKEAYYDGSYVTFAPMSDLARDARWGRIAETSGEDTYLSSVLTAAAVKGFQGDALGEEKIAACVKHFAAYGAAEAGLDYNTVDMSERTLREYYMPMYRAAVEAGVELVMTSFNTVDGIPSVGNRRLVEGILRDEWGFRGVVITDWAAQKELVTHGVAADDKEAAMMSMNASCDIEMVSTTYAQYLEELIAEGKVSMETLDNAVLRVLALKEKLGLLKKPNLGVNKEKGERLFCCEAHRDLARRAAEESAVLLKNNGVLPFDAAKVKTVAVIGPHADDGDIIGTWRCAGRAEDTVTVKMGFEKLLGKENVFYALGCSNAIEETDESGFDEAVALARTCDAVVLCVGENFRDTGEGTSKTDLTLTRAQMHLVEAVVAANANTAVLLFNGRPMCIGDLEEVAPAVLDMWFPGTEGGNAAANLVFGKVVPSGKVTASFPRNVGQCPIYYNHYNTGRPRVDDTKRSPYRAAYIDSPNSPLHSFGYGLSYTEFEYSDARVDKNVMKRDEVVTVSVNVKNVGKYKAKETVQLYIRDLVGSTVRPVKELKGFEKIELDVGETKQVSFTVDEDMLAFYGRDLVRKAENGKFHVFVGTDSNCEKCGEFELID